MSNLRSIREVNEPTFSRDIISLDPSRAPFGVWRAELLVDHIDYERVDCQVVKVQETCFLYHTCQEVHEAIQGHDGS